MVNWGRGWTCFHTLLLKEPTRPYYIRVWVARSFVFISNRSGLIWQLFRLDFANYVFFKAWELRTQRVCINGGLTCHLPLFGCQCRRLESSKWSFFHTPLCVISALKITCACLFYGRWSLNMNLKISVWHGSKKMMKIQGLLGRPKPPTRPKIKQSAKSAAKWESKKATWKVIVQTSQTDKRDSWQLTLWLWSKSCCHMPRRMTMVRTKLENNVATTWICF